MASFERLAERIMLLSGFTRIMVAMAAGALAVLALPPFDFFAVKFVSMPVLVWLLDGASGDPDRGFLVRMLPAFSVGWAFGFGYFVGGLWWIGNALLVEAANFAWAIPLAVAGLPAVLAVFYGVATALARLAWSDGLGRIAALAIGLALTEWLRGFILTGFPWNTLGYAAMPVPLLMQSAHVVGLLGVTALAVFVFSVPALFATRRGLLPSLVLAVLLAAGHVGYGAYTFARAEAPAGEDRPVVRLVQPSIPQSMKWSDAERENILMQHLDLTDAPGSGEFPPDLIVWPETAVPYILTEAPRALRAIADRLKPGQRLAAGAVRIDDSRPDDLRYYNSITVIDGSGQITAAADKVHLVPFGEYLPLADWLGRLGLDIIVEAPQGFSAAGERRLLDLGPGLLALPLICYEAIFPLDLGSLEARPDVLLNVTNDAWYGETPGPYQHFRQAQLRAAEVRIPLIRAANNGISAVTDSFGRVVGGLSLDAVGYVDVQLPPPAVPQWDDLDRQRNFWLIIGLLSLVVAHSRKSFIGR